MKCCTIENGLIFIQGAWGDVTRWNQGNLPKPQPKVWWASNASRLKNDKYSKVETVSTCPGALFAFGRSEMFTHLWLVFGPVPNAKKWSLVYCFAMHSIINHWFANGDGSKVLPVRKLSNCSGTKDVWYVSVAWSSDRLWSVWHYPGYVHKGTWKLDAAANPIWEPAMSVNIAENQKVIASEDDVQ